jgi:hypothetical protein
VGHVWQDWLVNETAEIPDEPRGHLFVADRLIFDRGELDPLEFLVEVGFLDERDYRDWLAGRRSDLQSALLCDVNEVIRALVQTKAYLLRQGLTATSRAHGDDETTGKRRLGSSPGFVEVCALRWVPVRAQLDLFQDSALALAEQSARTALASHRFDDIETELERVRLLGGDTSAYRRLVTATTERIGDVKEALASLEREIEPLAVRHLAELAREYLAPLWGSLAQRMPADRFDPSAPQLHPSYLLARAGLWQQVVEAIECVPGWQSQPVLLGRLAEAHSRLGHPEASRRLWSRLCWEHPEEAIVLLAQAASDPILSRRWREFTDLDPELPARDFPAWLLIADLRQRELVPPHCAPDDEIGRAYSAIHHLVSRHEDLDARRVVRDYNRHLLEHYLARRHPEGSRRL